MLEPRNSVPGPYLEHMFSSVLGAVFKGIDNLGCIQGRVIRIMRELETVAQRFLDRTQDIRVEKVN